MIGGAHKVPRGTPTGCHVAALSASHGTLGHVARYNNYVVAQWHDTWQGTVMMWQPNDMTCGKV